MSLVPWRRSAPLPFRTLQTEIDRLFDDFFDLDVGGTREAVRAWMPAVTIGETADAITVSAELPGMDPDDVEITMRNNVLVIRGERREESGGEAGQENVLRREFVYGSFVRQIPLPSDVDIDRAEAKMDRGILRLTLPKAETAKQRRIEIRSGAGDGGQKAVDVSAKERDTQSA